MCLDEIEQLNENGEIFVTSATEIGIYYAREAPKTEIEFFVGTKFAKYKEVRDVIRSQVIQTPIPIEMKRI